MSLFENYEQQFSASVADISYKINRIPNLNGDEKKAVIHDCEHSLEDMKELIEQMDLEVRDAPSTARSELAKKWNNYNTEYKDLETNFRKARVALMDSVTARTRLLGSEEDYNYTSEDQRTRLLENSDRINKSNNRLDDGLRIALETEQVGADIMTNLDSDREKIKRSRDRSDAAQDYGCNYHLSYNRNHYFNHLLRCDKKINYSDMIIVDTAN
ncbi:uncharacterized protein TRIADDRAFT_60180 [Trichoplax adhaerens]|uniref:Vesicle transport v-SNARE N-terminal domain-containing protein n=1 Tax=Trichoplax adhaerens TaxID=10228 RepID=B3S7I7_TRIAD|nr:hypothetical protein TRIADDRAFT_60180 [Trichoplax adhaerens]EDV21297.1 hypothetical protein TRIADDRAFT_60180 [Trichoplax adhaerens]|eukprot:XP_002116264.1 hypothetical protein TRIADDRAFT_60180 [Trichoplax adhaerens]